jgi:predicted amidohydrolase
VRNSTLVFDDTGRRVARYDKAHLFGFESGRERYDEAATIEAGNEVVLRGPCGEVGLSICYDLRFPELFRAMGDVSDRAARRLHPHHRPRPLGGPAARPRHRKPVLRARQCPGRDTSPWPPHLG